MSDVRGSGATPSCPVFLEEVGNGMFGQTIHEVGLTARKVTIPIVGGGAVRVLVCAEHAHFLDARYAPEAAP